MSKIKKITIENLVFGPDEEWFLDAEKVVSHEKKRTVSKMFVILLLLMLIVFSNLPYEIYADSIGYKILRYSLGAVAIFTIFWNLRLLIKEPTESDLEEMKFRLKNLEISKFKKVLVNFLIEKKRLVKSPSELKNLNKLAIKFANRIYKIEKSQAQLKKKQGIKNIQPVEKMCIDFYSF